MANSDIKQCRLTSKQQFDRQAYQYDSVWNSWSRSSLDWIVSNTTATNDDRILDIATGTGFTALAVAPFVRWVTAIDVSPGMLAEARKSAESNGTRNIAFEEAAAESLPFDNEAFTKVTCRIAPHHFADPQKFLDEAFRVLTAQGRLIIVDTTVPDNDEESSTLQNKIELERDGSHVRNYSPSEWNRMLRNAGFEILHCAAAEIGIAIPLESWMQRAGCTDHQKCRIHTLLKAAPESFNKTFSVINEDGRCVSLTWQRIEILATKTN